MDQAYIWILVWYLFSPVKPTEAAAEEQTEAAL